MSDQKAASYRLHDLRLDVRADAPLERPLAGLLVYLRAEPAGGSDDSDLHGLALSLAEADELPRVPASAVFAAPHERGTEVWQDSETGRLYLHQRRAHAVVDPAAGTADVALRRGAVADPDAALLVSDVVMLSLLALLRSRGYFMLHASAVSLDGRGCLFVGPSGSGKSTLAYALVREGWSYLADDMLLMRERVGRVEVLPLGREFRLAHTDSPFAELNVPDDERPDEPKRLVDVDHAYGAQHVKTCVPRAIVFPSVAGVPASRIEELRGAEVLPRLLAQTHLDGTDAKLATRQMALLKRLTDQTDAYRLQAGRDLHENPRHAVDLLAPLVTQPASAA